MANSRYEYHKEEEHVTEPRFDRGMYIIIRIDGDKFHRFSSEHHFDKPNDKRALDLMVDSAKQVIRTYRGHIPLAYGHSDEFSFLIRSSSDLMSRRIYKITSMVPVIFATHYNSQWDKFFNDPSYGKPVARKYDAWFDARPKQYGHFSAVIDYFRWRQIDCHVNNMYNTTLHALTGRYVRHELIEIDGEGKRAAMGSFKSGGHSDSGLGDGKRYEIKRTPISDWIEDSGKFYGPKEATDKLSKTVSSDKHDIMYLDYKINYNNELEQFKKGTVVVDTQRDFSGDNGDSEAIRHSHSEFTRSDDFWNENGHVFEHYVPLGANSQR